MTSVLNKPHGDWGHCKKNQKKNQQKAKTLWIKVPPPCFVTIPACQKGARSYGRTLAGGCQSAQPASLPPGC